MKIKLFDLIGIKSGMNFYSEAFYEFLTKNGVETQIVSNFAHNNAKAFLPNIFISGKLKNIANLFICYIKLVRYILKLGKNDYIVVFVYGLVIDIPLLLLAKFSKRVIIDIHEVISLDNKSGFLDNVFKFLYRTSPNKVISHSEKTDTVLGDIGYKHKAFFVPLFPYHINTEYDFEKVSEEVIYTFKSNLTYFLFFGNIRASKGITDLLSAIALVSDPNVQVVIAGQDVSGIINDYKKVNNVANNVNLITRHINDDELTYMFTKSNFILLPYDDISQSASIEVAITFKKPILTSNIKYFKTIIDLHPSFGEYFDTKNKTLFANKLMVYAQKKSDQLFYIDADIQKYFNADLINSFVSDIKAYNLTLNNT